MIVLGLETEADSGAAIVEDGRILAAVNEERICRLKLVEGFPRGAISEVLGLAGVGLPDLDGVLVASRNNLFVPELIPFEGWMERWRRSRGLGATIKAASGSLSRLHAYAPFLEYAYYLALEPTFRRRRSGIRRLLTEELGIRAPVAFVDHHLAHVTSAYFTSGLRDALIVSMDGGGDGKSALLYSGRDGRLEHLHEISAFNSLGNYYAYVTHMCGYQAHKHEGKITGLAAHGQPEYQALLKGFIDESGGTTHNHAGVVFRAAIQKLTRSLPSAWTKADLAASIQTHFEEVVVRLVSHWVEKTGHRNVALAGGVFANVRVNQVVHEIPGVERVFVHPGMGDGGLHVGAGLAACVPGHLPLTMQPSWDPLPHVYLGTSIGGTELDAALASFDLEPEALDGTIEERAAELLADGFVVARADGPMEYGPRALGNRTIMYQPCDPSVNDWLNERLRRTEFMPFAPAVLWEERNRCFEDLPGAEHAAEFMTITFRCTGWMRQTMPGVVHLDGTARPQLVQRDKNPGFYSIIEHFHRLTGLPAIINTSFNMHEEPIVRTAEDSVRAFLQGHLDYLILGPYLLRHPEGVTHERRRVRRPGQPGHVFEIS